jgi:CHAD domain-containing protein
MNKQPPRAPARILASQVRSVRHRYRKRLARCQKKFSEKAVHDLRVETRRILALLDLLGALGFAALAARSARSFKKRLDTFDDLRDTQVQLQLLQPLWTEFPEAHGLKSFLKRREEKLISKLARRIQSTKHARLNRRLKELEKCVGRSSRVSARATAAALQAMFRRVAALRRQVSPVEAATIHRVRVAFKRFRYVSELLRSLHPEFTSKRLARMKEYQAAAGDIQDMEVLLARLAQVVEDRKVNPASLRHLRNALRERRRRTIGAFMARIDELFEFKPEPGRSAGRMSAQRL